MANSFEHDIDQLVDNDELSPNLGCLVIRQNIASPEHVNPALVIDDKESESENVQNQNSVANTDSATNAKVSIETSSSASASGGNGSVPVLYTTGNGGGKVVKEEVVIKDPSGEKVIQTQRTCSQSVPEQWREIERQRPLRLKHIRFLKIFSVIAVILFFPLGIPAAYYAFKLQKEFDDGIMRGDIDDAQKIRRRVEHLIIFAGLLGLLTAVLIFALVERSILNDDNPNNMKNRILPG